MCKHGITYHVFENPFTPEELCKDDYEGFITPDLIRERFITTAFCSFAYHYAPVVSANKKSIQQRLEIESKRDEDAAASIFQVIHPSDIAWAVTVVLNNGSTWVESFDQEIAKADTKRKKREAEVIAELQARSTSGGNKRHKSSRSRRGRDPEPPDDEDNSASGEEPTTPEEGGDATTKVAPKRLWDANSNRRLQYNCGLNRGGRQFYRLFLKALKDVDAHEWDDVWKEFWDSEERGSASAKQKRRAPVQEDFGDVDAEYDYDDGEDGNEWDAELDDDEDE